MSETNNISLQWEPFSYTTEEKEIYEKISEILMQMKDLQLSTEKKNKLLAEKQILEDRLNALKEQKDIPQAQSEKITKKTKEQIHRIQSKYEHETRIWKNLYEYSISLSEDLKNTLVLRLRNKNSKNNPMIFMVSLEQMPVLSEEVDKSNWEKILLIKQSDIRISAIKKEGKWAHVYIDWSGNNITHFNYFKNFVFHSPRWVHNDIMSIIQRFLLEKASQEKEVSK